MGATLEALHRLQAIETSLYSLREKLQTQRRRIDLQARRVEKVRQSDQEQHEKLMRLQADIDRLELERKTREDEITKFREQMKITKTNKEYAAIRVQINTLDANNRKLEDRILGLMDQFDELKAQAGTIKEDLAQQTERLEKLEADLVDAEAESDPKIKELLDEREEAVFHVPATALQTFQRIAERHESEAMAQVVKPYAKREEFLCSGCQMSIPLESVNAIMNTDEVQTCNVCGRILYLHSPASTDQTAAP